MKRLFLLQSLLAALLALGVVVFAGRLVERAGPALRLDVTGRQPASLPADLRALLAGLDGELTATLFVSRPARMPSHLKDVEAAARDLLDEMVAAAHGRFRYRVIDPDLSGTAGARYAAARRVSPVRVRRVVDDAESQVEIWSSLVFARQGAPRREDVLIQGIENAHLPHLGALVAAHLRAARQPPQPVFAVSAPDGFEQLPRHLSQHGPVVDFDFDAEAAIPPDVDLLVWVAPRRVTTQHVAALKRLLASGRSAVLAGSGFELAYTGGDSALRVHARGTGPAWQRLLGPFGLQPVPDLVMDRNHGPAVVAVEGAPRVVEAPFHLRNLPAFRDFRPFRTPARGALSFVAASPLRLDPERIAAAGYRGHVAATTTERAWVQPLPEAPTAVADFAEGPVVPKQNLMVLLSPTDPWAGQLLVLASASPLRDGALTQPGYGHRILVDDLARTFAHPERLVRLRIDRGAPPPLPPVADAARVGWRLVVLGLGPLAWGLLALRRLRGEGWLAARARPSRSPGRRWRAPAVVAGLAGLWVLAGDAVSGLRLDATADRRHTPDPGVVERLAGSAGLRAEWVHSPAAALPPGVRAAGRRAGDLLAAAGVPVERRRPGVDGVTVESLRAAGLRPFEVERVRHDTTVTTEIFSALRLVRGEAAAVIPRLDAGTGAHLDFLLAGALDRLESGRAPVLAVVSDLPRLSPAEALEDYQKKGLSAPQGVDVYSRAKRLLGDYGYEVRHVSTRDPVFPAAPDAVLWFQPRRNSTPILTQLSDHLAGGGRAVVALQHYNIQQRQYRGIGFETVHWPQPQFQDFDRYLRLVGVEQAREVLFDRTAHHLSVDTQVNRVVREYDAQRVALPFLIRAVSHSESSPITRNLGDLLYIWGNRFVLDEAALRAAGVRAEVLVSTTDRAWAYDWSGGWLPAEVLEGGAYLPGPQPLAVRLEGRLPAVAAQTTDAGGTQLVPLPARAAGWLLLTGSSEMFKDPYLHDPAFDHDQFLLNTVAAAVYGPARTALQARHGGAAPGFAVQDGGTRALWRFLVIGGGPLLLGLAAAWRARAGGSR